MNPQRIISLLKLEIDGGGQHVRHSFLKRGSSDVLMVNIFPEWMTAKGFNYRASEGQAFAEAYVKLFETKFKAPEGTVLKVYRDCKQLDEGKSPVHFISFVVELNEQSKGQSSYSYEGAALEEFTRVHEEIAAEMQDPELHGLDGTPLHTGKIKKPTDRKRG